MADFFEHHNKDDDILIALMMEAVRTSETPVYFKETTRRCISEGCHLHTSRRENLKSYLNEASRFIGGGGFLNQLSDYQILKRDSDFRS
jgi:hypothetical protein